MTPTLSEFSYGFALTNELIDLAGEPLRLAPVFPSLIEEGRAGGGYDVQLAVPGFPLFVQFKRSDCLTRSNAREVVAGLPLSVPYHRFEITGRKRSAQHDMLCELDGGAGNQVFYAAPRFHEVAELDAAYLAGAVAERSFFVRPSEIGVFSDDGAHHVVFDGVRHFVCSKAREIKATRGRDILGVLGARLAADGRPLSQGPLDEALGRAEEVVARRVPARLRDQPAAVSDGRDPRPRRLADLALRFFNAQLFFVQPKPP